MKAANVRLRDKQGRTVDVPQADAGRLLDFGYNPVDPKQTVTLAEGGGEISLGDLVSVRNQYGITPRLELPEATFARTGEERFGGAFGTAAALAYGGAQSLSGGLAGKGLIETGLVEPETLGQLEATRPKTVLAGEMLGTIPLAYATGGLGAGRGIAGIAAREAAIGGIYGAGSEISQAAIEQREARPFEAGVAGTVAGGLLGGAFGAAEGAIARRQAAREAAAAAKAGEEAALRQGQAAVIDQAKDLATRMESTAGEYNSFLNTLEELGVSSPKALRKKYEQVGRTADALTDALTKATVEATTLNEGILPLRESIAQHKSSIARAVETTVKDRETRLGELLTLRATEEAERAAGRSTKGLLGKIKKAEADVSAYEAAQRSLENQARSLAETAGMVEAHSAGNAAAVAEASKVVDEMTRIVGQDARAAAEVGRVNAGKARINAEFEDAALREAGLTPTTDSVVNGALLAAKDVDATNWRPWLQRVMSIEAGSGRGASIFGQILANDSIMTKLPIEAAATMVRVVDRAMAEGSTVGFLKRTTAIGGNRPEFLRLSKNAERIRNLVTNAAGVEAKALLQNAGREADALVTAVRSADPAIAGEAIREFTSIIPKTEASVARSPITDAAHKDAVEQAVTAVQLQGSVQGAEDATRALAAREAKLLKEVAKLERAAGAQGAKGAAAEARLAKMQAELKAVTATRQASETTIRTARAAADEMRKAGAAAASATATERATIADLNRQMENVRAAAQLAEASAKVRALTEKQKAAVSLRELLAAKQQDFQTLRDGIVALEKEGGRFRTTQGRLVAPGEEALVNKQLKAFYKTEEGAKVYAALKGVGVEPESASTLGGVIGSAIIDSVFGYSLVGTIIGGFIGAKLGGRGAGKVVAQIMNQLKTTQAVDKMIAGFERVAPPLGRASMLSSTYKFPVQEAHSFVEDLKKERDAIGAMWKNIEAMPDINQRAIADAKARFDEVVQYLDRKRPPAGIVTGANATEFARAVAVIKNPELIQRFIRDGALRPSDVETLQRVSPAAYQSLSDAVRLLHVERPDMAIAPLFGLKKSKKKATGYTMSVYESQQYINRAPSRETSMQAGSDAAAARARPGSKSLLVENVRLR